MRKPKIRDWLLPVMLLAFAGLTISFMNSVFGLGTRWGVIGGAAVYVFARGAFRPFFRSHFELLTVLFAAWLFATVIWSEVPLLSFLKAGLFALITSTCLVVGQLWVRQHPTQSALEYLFPLTVVTLLAGVLGGGMQSEGLYEGLVGGSNMFGSLLAMVWPFLLWQTFTRWRSPLQRGIMLMLCAMDISFLVASGARSSMMAVGLTTLGLFLSLSTSRKMSLVILAIALLGVSLLGSGGRLQEEARKLIFKSDTTEMGLLHTRQEVWGYSWEGAEKGGWTGVGCGVSAGDKSFTGDFSEGLTSVGYGREKGNSQLGIVEESGLIGLVIYLLSLVALFSELGKAISRRPPGPEKALLSMVTGAIAGMLVQSFFEAWWMAGGAPESVYFWVLAGIALGLAKLDPKRAGRTQWAGGEMLSEHAPLRSHVHSSSLNG